ncbi:hypothetical protein AB0D49_03250 [Streptomyces sp. NPDC048290]|uniref:hypothetical protein n=1 Tax=Streptomyces sp. NPDC048290 TaxID=3155811 RepID=UPI003426DC5F
MSEPGHTDDGSPGADDGERTARGVPPGLPEELRSLGRSLDTFGPDAPETMVERVLGQILAEHLAVEPPEPPRPGDRLRDGFRAARRWTRVRRRSLTATLCAVLAVLALTPPVRAAVLDWFDFGGVEVRYDPSAPAPTPAEVPGCGSTVSVAEAERRAGWRPLVPEALGEPDGVAVTAGSDRRFLLTLCWSEPGGTIRLDQDQGVLDLGFVKRVREQPEWLSLPPRDADSVSDDLALWFPEPHELSYWVLAPDGDRFSRERRTAGPTLLWTHEAGTRSFTLRLEGVDAKERAVKIADSLRDAE